MEDIEGKGSASQNSELLKHWWDCSTACELVDGANYSEPCLEQTRSGMQVLDTKFFRLENPLQSSHRHGTLHWEGYRTMWQEKKQHWSKCTPYFMLQWSMEQNSAELCLEGPAFTSKLQEWGNSNILPMTEKREGVSLSCVKRWPVHRQGSCGSSHSLWCHHISVPWKHISVSHHSMMLRWHQFLVAP